MPSEFVRNYKHISSAWERSNHTFVTLKITLAILSHDKKSYRFLSNLTATTQMTGRKREPLEQRWSESPKTL